MNTHQYVNFNVLLAPKRYKLPELPEVIHTTFKDKNSGQIGTRGTIFTRRVKSLGGIFYIHYGMFYGIDRNGTTWIIELNPEGLVCITLQDFSKGLPVLYYPANYDIRACERIMDRVRERIGIPYNADSNNCETFVNYAVFAKLQSSQSVNTRKVADVVMSSLELYTALDRKSTIANNILMAMRQKFSIPRTTSVDNAFQNIKKSNAKLNLEDYAKLLNNKIDVSSKVVKDRLTFYRSSKRFIIIDEERIELYIKLRDYSSVTLTYNPPALKFPVDGFVGNWVKIDVKNAGDFLCKRLIDEACE